MKWFYSDVNVLVAENHLQRLVFLKHRNTLFFPKFLWYVSWHVKAFLCGLKHRKGITESRIAWCDMLHTGKTSVILAWLLFCRQLWKIRSFTFPSCSPVPLLQVAAPTALPAVHVNPLIHKQGRGLFNIAVNDLDERAERTLTKFVDHARRGRAVSMVESTVTIQRHFGRLGRRTDRSLGKLSKGKKANAESCTWDGVSPWSRTGWKAALQQRTSWTWVRQCVLAAERPAVTWAALASVASRVKGKGVYPLFGLCETTVLQNEEGIDILEHIQQSYRSREL